MNIKGYLPTGQQLTRDTIVALVSVVLAAWIISRFPAVKKFVKDNSLTVNDTTGNTLF